MFLKTLESQNLGDITNQFVESMNLNNQNSSALPNFDFIKNFQNFIVPKNDTQTDEKIELKKTDISIIITEANNDIEKENSIKIQLDQNELNYIEKKEIFSHENLSQYTVNDDDDKNTKNNKKIDNDDDDKVQKTSVRNLDKTTKKKIPKSKKSLKVVSQTGIDQTATKTVKREKVKSNKSIENFQNKETEKKSNKNIPKKKVSSPKSVNSTITTTKKASKKNIPKAL